MIGTNARTSVTNFDELSIGNLVATEVVLKSISEDFCKISVVISSVVSFHVETSRIVRKASTKKEVI